MLTRIPRAWHTSAIRSFKAASSVAASTILKRPASSSIVSENGSCRIFTGYFVCSDRIASHTAGATTVICPANPHRLFTLRAAIVPPPTIRISLSLKSIKIGKYIFRILPFNAVGVKANIRNPSLQLC